MPTAMTSRRTVILAMLLASTSFSQAAPTLELGSTILDASEVAADVSQKSYETPPNDPVHYEGYDSFKFYTDDDVYPNQMVVAKKDGRCYLGFRGTTDDVMDWLQNLLVADQPIHKDNDPSEPTCTARLGFSTFLESGNIGLEAIQDVEECTQDYCTDANDCLVITGHSKGGAQATVASIVLHKYNPTVITFGGVPAVDKGCPYIPSERTYRYVNSIPEQPRIIFDMVPFLNIENLPSWMGGSCGFPTASGEAINEDEPEFAELSALQESPSEEVEQLQMDLSNLGHLGDHYGHGIVLGSDPDNVKPYAWNTENLLDNQVCLVYSTGVSLDSIVAAHSMTTHLERVRDLRQAGMAGVKGFREGTEGCDWVFPDLCSSGSCDSRNNVCRA